MRLFEALRIGGVADMLHGLLQVGDDLPVTLRGQARQHAIGRIFLRQEGGFQSAGLQRLLARIGQHSLALQFARFAGHDDGAVLVRVLDAGGNLERLAGLVLCNSRILRDDMLVRSITGPLGQLGAIDFLQKLVRAVAEIERPIGPMQLLGFVGLLLGVVDIALGKMLAGFDH